MGLQIEQQWASFGGVQRVYSHDSDQTHCRMEFAVYTPPQVGDGAGAGPAPVLYYLSGLTCTWENATTKAGWQRAAAEHGVIIVAPDTSPRGENVPDADRYDFGSGAGFYVDATRQPWSKHYRMYSYITQELTGIVAREIVGADPARQGILGHSMGGHGALTIALKNPDLFRSVSAFAPISSPMRCPWGQGALGGYLGQDEAAWAEYDACALIAARGWSGDILVDQGAADQFLEEQLKPELLEQACAEAGVSLTLRRQPGYDHSYYFIASFIDDHMRWHMERLV
ncbi:MAG: S-formylglutathione hydrolase [Alphaproteobacteria bacterium]|nr:S-formylglutathione hydrolase [Alphaproteobacteria bacterium]